MCDVFAAALPSPRMLESLLATPPPIHRGESVMRLFCSDRFLIPATLSPASHLSLVRFFMNVLTGLVDTFLETALETDRPEFVADILSVIALMVGHFNFHRNVPVHRAPSSTSDP
jgi:hypothetical protein